MIRRARRGMSYRNWRSGRGTIHCYCRRRLLDKPNSSRARRAHGKLKPLETKSMTVSEPPPRTNRFGSPLKLSEVHWVKPKLVAQVKYQTWTGDGLLRQVVYLGLRADKPPREIVMERPVR